MIDISKPRDYNKWLELEEDTGTALITVFPLKVYIDGDGKSRKFCTNWYFDGTEYKKYNFGEMGYYTDIPCIMIKIEDYLYYVPISENPKPLVEIPEKYKDDVKIILDFIGENYELFLLHWKGYQKTKIGDTDIYYYIYYLKTMTVERSAEDFQYAKTKANNIRRRLRKLKKHKKLSEDFKI